MEWKLPPVIKVYEALGCIADGRVQEMSYSAQVYSSSRSKFYSVLWDGTDHIMCNDNGSFYVGYLGYPAIAFLCLKGVLPYTAFSCTALRDIPWKEINKRTKNNWEASLEEVKNIVEERGADWDQLVADVQTTYAALKFKPFHLLGEKMKPPQDD